jgi:Uma2 family endonuclease
MSILDVPMTPTGAVPQAAALPASIALEAIEPRSLPHCVIHSEETSLVLPGWVVNLETFRAWAHAGGFPERGRLGFLDGLLWADLSMEEIITHSLVKTRFTITTGALVDAGNLGYFFADGVLLSNPSANLSTEPDAMFCLWDTERTGKVRFVPGAKKGFMELEGSPDWVLEIVSESSIKKDKEILPVLYFRAGIVEFWLVDARSAPAEFTIYCRGAKGFEAQPATAKGVFSPLFARHFLLTQDKDPLGRPQFKLAVEA